MRSFLFLLLFLSFCKAGFTMIPPFYETRKELQELLFDPRLESSFGSAQAILEIKRTDRGYQIVGTTQLMDVDIHYVPVQDGRIGAPPCLEWTFHPPVHR